MFFTSLLPPSATFSLLQANTASFNTLLPKAADMWGCCVYDSQSKLMREWMLNRQHIDRQHRLRHIIWICNRSLDVTLAYERQEPSQTGLQPRGCLPSLTSRFTFMTVQTRVIHAVTTSMEVWKRCYIYNIIYISIIYHSSVFTLLQRGIEDWGCVTEVRLQPPEAYNAKTI